MTRAELRGGVVVIADERVSAYRGPSLSAPQLGVIEAGEPIGVVADVISTDVLWFVCVDPEIGRYFVPVLDETCITGAPARRGLGAIGDVDVLPFDLSRTASERAGFNAGCPTGYFAQFVAGDVAGATQYAADKYARCRLLATSTAATNQDETGTTLEEWWQALRDGIADTADHWGVPVALLVGGGALVALLVLKR